MSEEYCPDCVERMVDDKKKLGQHLKWLICPKCGYRKRAEWEQLDTKAIDRYESVNQNNFFHGFDEENKNY